MVYLHHNNYLGAIFAELVEPHHFFFNFTFFLSKQHTIQCGGGTGVFLVVTSTYIIVIRGRRACLWGSLYLDDFDEEDRDLK